MTYVGFPKVGIYAKGHTTNHATSKTDFDIMVRILDVYPDGREMLITEGVVNAKSREYAKAIAQSDTNETILLTNIDNDTYYHFEDRKSTRLNSSHVRISYAVFCLKNINV